MRSAAHNLRKFGCNTVIASQPGIVTFAHCNGIFCRAHPDNIKFLIRTIIIRRKRPRRITVSTILVHMRVPLVNDIIKIIGIFSVIVGTGIQLHRNDKHFIVLRHRRSGTDKRDQARRHYR